MSSEQNCKLADTSLDLILVIIPMLNEAATIAGVVENLQRHGITRIRAVDNGSTDSSAEEAKKAGAEVVFEPIAGYGQACWRGLQNLPPDIDWILFCDGDGSDDLNCLPGFFRSRDRYDLILGDRRATATGKAALTPVQNFGNGLASRLISLGWGYRYGDLGPLRLIKRAALEAIAMEDRGFGWTVEMQVKAIKDGLNICEVPVNYLPRQGGKSKISGTIAGSFKAGIIILSTLGKLYFLQQDSAKKPQLLGNKLLLWLSAILLLSGAVAIAPYGDFRQPEAVIKFWLGMGVMSLGFIFSWRLKSLSAWWFWLIASVSRLIILPMYPGDDLWRYLWEGYLQTQGINPYNFAPNAAELIPYRTEWWFLINHRGVSAIYPPITQLGFRWLAFISPHFLWFKAAFIAADLLICWLLSRRFNYLQTTFYAWNPLVIYSFAGGGHYDSWFILPLVAAWLIADDVQSDYATANPADHSGNNGQNSNIFNWLLSAFLVGISIAIKWVSLPILGFIAKQAWRKVNLKTAIMVCICGILPLGLTSLSFCNLEACSLIPTSSTFVSYGRSAEFIPYLLRDVWTASSKTNSILAIPLGLSCLFLLAKACNMQQFTQGYFFALLTISPIIHGWYFTWIMPFAVATKNLGVRLVSISALIYFVLPYRQALGIKNWRLTMVETLCLWLPFFLGYFWHSKRAVGNKQSWGVLFPILLPFDSILNC